MLSGFLFPLQVQSIKISRECIIYPPGFPLFFTGFFFLLFLSCTPSCPTLHAYMYHEFVSSFSICNLLHIYRCKNDSEFKCYV